MLILHIINNILLFYKDYLSCIFLDSSGEMIKDSYIKDIFNGQCNLDNYAYPITHTFSDGKYGVFTTTSDNNFYNFYFLFF